MPQRDLGPLRAKLQSALAAGDFARHAAALAPMIEGCVLLDAPPEARPTLPADIGTMPAADAARIYRDATAELQARLTAALPLGASRFGGLPDLPPDFAWPAADGRKLQFLAQLDLADLPRWAGSPLPADGWLYHFGLYENEHDWVTVVRHHAGPRSALVRQPLPPPGEIWMDRIEWPAYELLPLAGRLGATIDGTRAAKAVGEDPFMFASDLSLAVAEADAQDPPPAGHRDVGWMLGEIDGTDGTTADMAGSLGLPGDDWINLLAIRSRGTMQWGDSGTLYALVRRLDLARGDFSAVEIGMGSA